MTPQRIAFVVVLLLWIAILVAVTIGLHADPAIMIIVGVIGWLMVSRLFRPPVRRSRQPKGTPKPMPSYDVVARKLDAIEAEMRRVGLWQETPLQPDQYQFRAAFAADTMAFPQWLQSVFIPNVRSIIDQRGTFPASSQVAAYAVREFDTYGDVGNLTTLLAEFDYLFR